MKFKLMLVRDIYPWGDPMWMIIEKNFDTRQQAANAKRAYKAARGGIVAEAVNIAKAAGLRSAWKIEEYK